MNESKRVKESVVDECLKFGWQKAGTEVVGRGKKARTMYVLTRETTIANHSLLVELEKQYIHLCRQIKVYKPLNPFILILLFILGVIPAFVYLGAKTGAKSSIEKKNAELEEQKATILAEVRELRRYKYVADKPIF